MRFAEVDPANFVHQKEQLPAQGRSAWRKAGIGTGYRYQLRPGVRIGNEAEKSLDHWAVSAAVAAIQARLYALSCMDKVAEENEGNFGRKTEAGVRMFQKNHSDPSNGDRPLTVDGIVGHSDAAALFTPLIDAAARSYNIPDNLLRGEIAHESALDPGALGYYIYYAVEDDNGQTSIRYGGVDRALCQINSKENDAVSWFQAFDPAYSVVWSASRMRSYFKLFTKDYDRPDAMCWDAAVCAHNSPVRAHAWLKNGYPSVTAAAYVNFVKKARY